MSDRTCIECGNKALVEHDGLVVCEECSTVQSEDLITSEHHDIVGYQAASENLWIKQDKNKSSSYRTPYGKKSVQLTMKVYGQIFSFTPDMLTNAENMFNKLFEDPDLKHKTCLLKLSVGLACLYIVGRRYQKTVSLKKFCTVTGEPVSKLVQALKLVTLKLSLSLPCSSVIEITVEIAREHNLQRDIVSTAIEILHICDKAWLTTGRQPQKYVWVAFFIASKSQDISGFQRVTYKKFLDQYGIKKHNMTDLNEILKILTDLGQHIPWASNKGKDNFVFCNLKDILKYSEMAMLEQKRILLEESNTDKRKLIDNDNIYQPPALKYRKQMPVVTTENTPTFIDTENLSSDIEEELDAYIRSDNEIQEIQKARELIIDN